MWATRGCVVELVNMLKLIVADVAAPLPLDADVICNRGESDTAVQKSPGPQKVPVRVKEPAREEPVVPDPLPTFALGGLMEKTHVDADPVCVTVNGWPAMVSVPIRWAP